MNTQLELDFFNASEFETRLKCTIQKTGKLGFNESAIKKLHLNENKSIKFGKSKDIQDVESLYMVILDGVESEAFKVNKAGTYYYLNTKGLFDKLGYDYSVKTIMFDIIEVANGVSAIYKLIKREVPRKQRD
jgi:hypothetical protein